MEEEVGGGWDARTCFCPEVGGEGSWEGGGVMEARLKRAVGEGGEEGKETEAEELPWEGLEASYFCINSKN